MGPVTHLPPLLSTTRKETRGAYPAVQGLRLRLPVPGGGFDPCSEAKIAQASRPNNQNVKQKQYCNKFNKDFEEKKKRSTSKKKKKTLKKKKTWVQGLSWEAAGFPPGLAVRATDVEESVRGCWT